MIKNIVIMLTAVLITAGLTLIVATSDVVSPIYGIVIEMVILAGYLSVGALVADKVEEWNEADMENEF